MKGYVVIDTEVVDAGASTEFFERIPQAMEACAGRYLVRSTSAEAIEGGWSPQRLVIMEFDDLQAARAFLDSAEYKALDELRGRAITSKVVVVEGYAA